MSWSTLASRGDYRLYDETINNKLLLGSFTNKEYDDDKEKTDGLKMSQDIICKLLAAILNFSDLSDNFVLACDEVGMVPLLIDMIKELQDSIPHHVKYVVSMNANIDST